MVMRAYAFSGRNRWVLIPLATCYLGLLAVNVWVFCIRIEAIPPSFYILIGGTGCFPNYGDQVMAEKIGVSIFLKIKWLQGLPSVDSGLWFVFCSAKGWHGLSTRIHS